MLVRLLQPKLKYLLILQQYGRQMQPQAILERESVAESWLP